MKGLIKKTYFILMAFCLGYASTGLAMEPARTEPKRENFTKNVDTAREKAKTKLTELLEKHKQNMNDINSRYENMDSEEYDQTNHSNALDNAQLQANEEIAQHIQNTTGVTIEPTVATGEKTFGIFGPDVLRNKSLDEIKTQATNALNNQFRAPDAQQQDTNDFNNALSNFQEAAARNVPREKRPASQATKLNSLKNKVSQLESIKSTLENRINDLDKTINDKFSDFIADRNSVTNNDIIRLRNQQEQLKNRLNTTIADLETAKNDTNTEQKREQAATKIQKLQRGISGRKAAQEIRADNARNENIKDYFEQSENIKDSIDQILNESEKQAKLSMDKLIVTVSSWAIGLRNALRETKAYKWISNKIDELNSKVEAFKKATSIPLRKRLLTAIKQDMNAVAALNEAGNNLDIIADGNSPENQVETAFNNLKTHLNANLNPKDIVDLLNQYSTSSDFTNLTTGNNRLSQVISILEQYLPQDTYLQQDNGKYETVKVKSNVVDSINRRTRNAANTNQSINDDQEMQSQPSTEVGDIDLSTDDADTTDYTVTNLPISQKTIVPGIASA